MSESFKTRTAFIMASVGSAVGLGNIFRFPALAVKYGLAFIIVYTILLFTIGIPMLSAELAVGRKFSMSAVGSARKILKKAEFAGWLAAANSFVIASYYCVLFSMVLLCAVFSYRLYDMSVDGMLVFKDILYTSQLRIEVVLGLIAAWAAVYLCFGRAEKLGIISTVSVMFAVVVIFLLAVWRGLSSSDQLNSFLRFDVGVLYSRGFWGDVSIEANQLTLSERATLLGHTYSSADGIVVKADDQAPYVGVGAIAVEMVSGTKAYVGKVYHKLMFKEPNDENATKQENVAFAHTTLEADVVPQTDYTISTAQSFETEAAAVTWIKGLLDIT